ncbi:Predicted arabinose efflux permease, MFS family [Pustulibacterium marinum]|uniref:Predicted arabinose efflux permease, MFS family n=1 Tax=Pustulibacterium marinum TaxID=1224947 RepID=A0A1I7HXQ8_9FLAO|nr:MFS transporter [Pustulibacterium marinum]SFU65470.1 Predicted arabinose efflux permease, MFS family [Pustulibacterium marinum]
MNHSPEKPSSTKQGLSKSQIAAMSVTSGICVATIYYNQPLLHDIAQTFKVDDNAAGTIAVLAQAGYGLGLFFITPLGDKMDRKKLILIQQALLVIALLGMSFAPSILWAVICSLVIGFTAIAAQVILPLAASLSPKDKKGNTVGVIFTGILIGILAARVLSGYIADWFGWEMVYVVAAVSVMITFSISWFALPSTPPEFDGSYKDLIGSVLKQIKRFGLLRNTATLGGLAFGVFCSFWATLTFHLSGDPFHYSTDTIGLFGALAIGGALLAPVVGKMADKGKPQKAQLLALIILTASVLLMLIWPTDLWAILATVFFLDVGVQSIQVTNVALIYTLDASAHSRINTVYMTGYFIGGALGSFVGIHCWDLWGWTGVVYQLLVWCALAFIVLGYKMLKK